MVLSNIIIDEIKNLEKDANEIEQLATELIKKVSISHYPGRSSRSPYVYDPLTKKEKEIQRIVVRKYQKWYLKSYQLIKEYLKEKENEFKKCYEDEPSRQTKKGVIDFLQFRSRPFSDDNNEILDSFLNIFDIQVSIILSIPDVLKIRELNLEKIISKKYIDREIEEAELLINNGFYRAGGIIAGIVIEKHLKSLCKKYNVSFSQKATIDPLAQELYKHKKIDISDLKMYQYYGSIRNKCAHDDTISKEEVNQLINGVKKFN